MDDRSTVVVLATFLVLVFSACAPDAPHDNAIDPGSPNYKSTGAITGRVQTLGLPYTGIPNATVLVVQSGASQLSGPDGSFALSAVPSGQITLIVSRSAYLTDTTTVTVSLGQTRDIEIHLDALPQVSSPQIITNRIDQWWPGPDYTAQVNANISDPDGRVDIDSVYVQVDSVSFAMIPSAGNNYQVAVDASQLPGQDIQWLVGKELTVCAADHEGGVGRSPGFYVTRIIESEASPTYPTGLDTASATPQFDWNPDPVPVSFSYSYQLQVVKVVQGSQTIIWTQPGLSSSLVSFTYPGVLVSGNYFWTVSIVDAFGNTSTSKEATFAVH